MLTAPSRSSALFAFALAFAAGAFVHIPATVAADASSKPSPDGIVALSRFMGAQNCSSSSCHGGGVGKDQCGTWYKWDSHSRASATLGSDRSKKMGVALGVADPAKTSQCTICHSPMESVKASLLSPMLKKPDRNVSCEACHGPAERWFLFHTRTDTTHAQRVGQGMRELEDLYARATSCVGCHANLPTKLLDVGHPELRMEFARQIVEQPPHWTEKKPWPLNSAWLVGEATSLRELSAQLKADPTTAQLLAPRWQALAWLLRLSTTGRNYITEPAANPGPDDFRAMVGSADRLARAAAKLEGSKSSTFKQFSALLDAGANFQPGSATVPLLKRRAQALVAAYEQYLATLAPQKQRSGAIKKAMADLYTPLKDGALFDPAEFPVLVRRLALSWELTQANQREP